MYMAQDIAGGCKKDARALFACVPHRVKPGPPPPPPPPGHDVRHCINANVSAGWAGYPQNVGGDCGWAAIQSHDGGWVNATVTIKGAGATTQLVLEAPKSLVSAAAAAAAAFVQFLSTGR
jgi:hypothetical protein